MNSGKHTTGNKRSAKLTPSEVIEMRRLYSEEGWTQGRCARHFGISVGQVGRIVRGEHWQEYTQPPTQQEIDARSIANPRSEGEVEASQVKLAELLSIPSAAEEAVGVDVLEEILRRRSGDGDPLARFRTNQGEPNVEPIDDSKAE